MPITLKLFERVDGTTCGISFSPAAWRAKFALNCKNVTYDSIPLPLLKIPIQIPKAWKHDAAEKQKYDLLLLPVPLEQQPHSREYHVHSSILHT